LKKLVETLGPKWGEKYIVPKLLTFQTNPNYLYRENLLFGTNAIAPLVSSESLERHLIPGILALASDKIPNIRFNVCKTFVQISKLVKDATIKV
jgi:serine/threonine-protein phosphatase 2A regulatory subunit A